MSYFDRRPQVFRLLFGIVTMYLVAIAGVTFYRFASSPTDENLFSNPPSYMYITKNIPTASSENTSRKNADSIRAGDLLLNVNGIKPVRNTQLDSIVSAIKEDGQVRCEVFRLSEGKEFKYTATRRTLPADFYRQLSSAAHVVNVTEGGASDRAGMKVGDLILRINGQTFTNVNQADSILRTGQIGKSLSYEILRDNETTTLHVTLATFGFPITLLLFVFSGVAFLATGIFIGIQRPHIIAARLIGIFFLAIGFTIIAGPIQRDLQIDWFVHVRSFTLIAAIFFGFAASVHGGHYFPAERPELISRRWVRFSGYLLAACGIPCVYLFGLVGLLVGIGAMVVYSTVIPIIYRRQCPPEYRKLNRVVKWSGIVVGVLSSILFFFIIKGGPATLPLLGYLAVVLLLIPFSYLYTIGRYRLLDLNLRVRKNVQYSFVSVAWVTLTIVGLLWMLSALLQSDLGLPNVRLTGASIEVTEDPMLPQNRAILEKSAVAILAIGLTFLFRWAGKSGQGFIAKKFYRAQYDYRRAASELAEVMATKLNMNDLARGIVEKLAELMQLKRTGVMFLRNQLVCCCNEVEGFNGTAWKESCLRIAPDFVQAMNRFSGEINVDYLPKEIKDVFRQNEFQYVIPIRSKDKLVGTLLIGEKRSESTFQHDDLEFLTAVAKQASVAVENAFLYEELAGQERMKHELEIARRIQIESLPQTTPNIVGLDISGISIPAMEVGGDYFDYLNGNPGELTVIVGDVSGKGTSAALYMSKVQGILRSLHGFGLSPRDLFIRANHLLCGDLEKKSFVTAIGAAFDTRQRSILLSRAGHLPLYYYNAKTRGVERIIPRGLGLGLSAEDIFESEIEEKLIQYATGDVFLFVTDGITEGKQTNGDEFGETRLVKVLATAFASNAENIRDCVINSVSEFAATAEQHDDQTVVVVKAT